jgi:hypothetical protein
MSGVPLPGERVSYATAARAHRQANERAFACSDLTRADLIVLANALEQTTTFSKLAARLRAEKLDRGVSRAQRKRSLRKLDRSGVLVWIAGQGAGRLTIIGIPPHGMSAAEYQKELISGALSEPEKRAHAARPSRGPKKGSETPLKKGSGPSRARGVREKNTKEKKDLKQRPDQNHSGPFSSNGHPQFDPNVVSDGAARPAPVQVSLVPETLA